MFSYGCIFVVVEVCSSFFEVFVHDGERFLGICCFELLFAQWGGLLETHTFAWTNFLCETTDVIEYKMFLHFGIGICLGYFPVYPARKAILSCGKVVFGAIIAIPVTLFPTRCVQYIVVIHIGGI